MYDEVMNKLYFGDNLDILREHIKDETIDLIYLAHPLTETPITTYCLKRLKVTNLPRK